MPEMYKRLGFTISKGLYIGAVELKKFSLSSLFTNKHFIYLYLHTLFNFNTRNRIQLLDLVIIEVAHTDNLLD